MKALRFLVAIFLELCASAQNTSYTLSNPVTIGGNGTSVPYPCQTATCATSNSGSEVLFNQKSGSCTAFWSMSITGTGITNLSALYSGLPSQATHNQGNARWSPDGKWFLLQAQDAGTSLACTSAYGGLGIGTGSGVFLCRVANLTCYEVAVQGDNTGHFCAAGVVCPVMATLVNYVDDNHGWLHPHFTPDGTKIYGMYVMGRGTTPPSLEGINGTLRWCGVTLPGSGPPTITGCSETDVGPLGDGTGTKNWYEGAGAMPTSVEATTQTIFATGINNADGAFAHTGILSYNISTGANAWLTPTNCYQEFWEVRPQGDIGAGATCQFLPPTLSLASAVFPAGPMDVGYGPATTGKTTQLTFFNNVRPLGIPMTIMSSGAFDWTGTFYLVSYVPANNTSHAATSSYILKFSFTTTPQSGVVLQ